MLRWVWLGCVVLLGCGEGPGYPGFGARYSEVQGTASGPAATPLAGRFSPTARDGGGQSSERPQPGDSERVNNAPEPLEAPDAGTGELVEACLAAQAHLAECADPSLEALNCSEAKLLAQVSSRCTPARILEAYACLGRLSCGAFAESELVFACVPSGCARESL